MLLRLMSMDCQTCFLKKGRGLIEPAVENTNLLSSHHSPLELQFCKMIYNYIQTLVSHALQLKLHLWMPNTYNTMQNRNWFN